MIFFAAAAVPLCGVVYALYKQASTRLQFERDKWADEVSLRQREMILREEQFNLEKVQFQQAKEEKVIPPKPSEPMPDDIYLECQSESSSWAREDAMAKAMELYEELGDWHQVRRRIFPGSTEVEL